MTITTADRIINALRQGDAHPACAADITDEALARAYDALAGLTAQARAWNWRNVEAKLDRAYRAIGAVNPADGYAYHCGTHPVQLAEADIERQIDAADDAASERYQARKAARIAQAEAARTAARRA